jgi:hypothetical protein
MKHAFQEIDLDRTGRVTKNEFRKVLKEFDLKLSSDKQVEDFLSRFVRDDRLHVTTTIIIFTGSPLSLNHHSLTSRNFQMWRGLRR